MTNTILVAGGAGFIGSNLCKALLSRGEEVICVDNLYTSDYGNIRELFNYSKFHFLKESILNLKKLENITQIYNLACPASPIKYQRDPIYTIKTCIDGSINLLEFARSEKIKILQASTSEVYGNPTEHPQKESYCGNVNCIGPRSCYDEGKRLAETLFFEYKRIFGVDIRVVRIFNTYGPNMSCDDGRVVSNFIVQALKNQSITIYGDGTQTRSFCYIDDLINGMVQVMESEINFVSPINIGNPTEISVKNLAEIIVELTQSNSNLVYHNLPVDDPIKRKPDIELIKSLIGWYPKVDLYEGLKRTIDFFKGKVNSSF